MAGEGVSDLEGAGTMIVFRVADRDYGLPVEDVVEVIRMVAVTGIPDAPPWVSGVIDLRGRTLPVVALRERFGLLSKPPDLDTMIIVARHDHRFAGLIVDDAVEAITVPAGAITSPDEMVGDMHPLSGIMSINERLILVLDAARLLGGLDELRVPDDESLHV